MRDYITDSHLAARLESETSAGRRLFDRLGGRPALDRVHKIFYEKLYEHRWLSQFFVGIDREHIANQQSDFMGMLFGGPKIFSGRMPIDAHMHMLITEKLFDIRHELLRESLCEACVPGGEANDWLAVDLAFKKVVVKSDITDCRRRFATDEIVAPVDPEAADSGAA